MPSIFPAAAIQLKLSLSSVQCALFYPLLSNHFITRFMFYHSTHTLPSTQSFGRGRAKLTGGRERARREPLRQRVLVVGLFAVAKSE